ncbi:Chitinase [Luteimicrobium xylanilyticum]|uniref:Chitinase n=2 Tax=Luteimicrobium xylanilyticum TaxID=1133546 RepID=A0A5P9QFD9_9MICO|nr:Chitinase [Luteimicrobium xylanilyticum]
MLPSCSGRQTRGMTRRHLHAPHVARTTTAAVALVVVGLLSAGTLAACDDGTQDAASPATGGSTETTPSPTSTADDTTGTGSTPTSGSTEDGAGTGSTSGTTKGSGSGSTPTSSSLRVARCTAGHLTGTLTEGEGGGAGSTFPYLVLKNTGSSPCQLQGWPGVSFVGDDNGTQLGAAATFDRSSPHATVTLLPNGHAHAPLKIAQAANYDKSTCKPQKADGLRVYVPGETHSIFVKASGLTACTNKKVQLLQTQAIQPGAD